MAPANAPLVMTATGVVLSAAGRAAMARAHMVTICAMYALAAVNAIAVMAAACASIATAQARKSEDDENDKILSKMWKRGSRRGEVLH